MGLVGGVDQDVATSVFVPLPTSGKILPGTSGLDSTRLVMGAGPHVGDQTDGTIANPLAAYRIDCTQDVVFVGFDSDLIAGGLAQKTSGQTTFAKTSDLNSVFTFQDANDGDFSPSGVVEELTSGVVQFRMSELPEVTQ